jgi:hypothetical protein
MNENDENVAGGYSARVGEIYLTPVVSSTNNLPPVKKISPV